MAEAQRDRLLRALRHGRHGDGLEGVLDVGTRRRRRTLRPAPRLQRELLAAAAGRDQAHAGFDQADVASSANTARVACITNSQPPPSAMPCTAATTGTMGNRGPSRPAGTCDGLLRAGRTARRGRPRHLLQVGADRKGRVVPDHQAVRGRARRAHDRLEQAVHDLLADGVHLGLDRHDADARVLRRRHHRRTPSFSHRVSPRSSAASPSTGSGRAGADTPAAPPRQGGVGGAVITRRRMHALAPSNTQAGSGTPDIAGRRRCRRDGSGHRLPARGLPGLERPCAQPKPQRIARSMSRALSAMSPRCTAQ